MTPAARRRLLGAAVALALAATFAAYLNPHFLVDVANAVWSCF